MNRVVAEGFMSCPGVSSTLKSHSAVTQIIRYQLGDTTQFTKRCKLKLW
jgi:hypothetical protein